MPGTAGLDAAWIERWRDDVRTDLRRLLGTFESRFGYPPGEHHVDGPATAAELAGAALPGDLLSLHRLVAEVRLPDVGAGYWIHRPPLPGTDPGHPRRLSDGRELVVFGSDGGGARYALGGGPVLRLADGALVGDAYDADRAVPVAADLREFLAFLRREVADLVDHSTR